MNGYLRVKNWLEFQHYSDRRPPWIKLHRKVLDSGEKFMLLGELEQWQLARLWIVASCSELFTLDESKKTVPVLPHDEGALRRSIMTLRRIPLAKFVREGFVLEVAEAEVFALAPGSQEDSSSDLFASTGASADASVGASALANAPASDRASAREQEVSEKDLDLRTEVEVKSTSTSRSLAIVVALPLTAQELVAGFVDLTKALGGEAPPRRVTGQVARLCGELLAEGITAASVQAGIELLLEKRLHPSTLPSLVHEASLPRRGSRLGRVTPSELMARAKELHDAEKEMFHDAG